MGNRFLYRGSTLMLSFMLSAAPVLAQDQQRPLEEQDNPLLISKRDINNNQINYYALEKEAALGRRLPAMSEVVI
jgi:hypothetical protein